MLYFMRFLSLLTARDSESVLLLRRASPLLLIISIISGKPYHTIQKQVARNRSDDDDDEEDEWDAEIFEAPADTSFTPQQQRELLALATELIERTVEPSEIPAFQSQFLDCCQAVLKVQDEVTSTNCEVAMVRLGYVCLVPQYAE